MNTDKHLPSETDATFRKSEWVKPQLIELESDSVDGKSNILPNELSYSNAPS